MKKNVKAYEIKEEVDIISGDTDFYDSWIYKTREEAIRGLQVEKEQFRSWRFDEWRENKYVAIAALKESVRNWSWIRGSARKDKDVHLAALFLEGRMLSILPPEVADTEEMVAVALESNPLAFQYVSDRLKDNPYIVSLAVKDVPWAIKYASDRIRAIVKGSEDILGTLEKLTLHKGLEEDLKKGKGKKAVIKI